MTTTTESPTESIGRFLSGALTNRVLAIVFGVGAVFLVASLFSHSYRDASFWNATGADARNWMGALGANISCALYSAFGNASWLLPVGLGVWSWRLASGEYYRWVINPVRLGVSTVLTWLMAPAFLSAIPGKMAQGTGYGGWIGDRMILPFARMFDKMSFEAPYQIPGLLMAIGALVAFAAACGMTRAEVRYLWRQGYERLRQTFSRERQRSVAGAVVNRSRGLVASLRERTVVAENPVSLRGDRRTDALAPKRKTKRTARKARPETEDEKPVARTKKKRRKARQAVPLDLLATPQRPSRPMTALELKAEGDTLLRVLNDYGVQGKMLAAKQGPVVTLHELEPAAGTKAARVVGLSDDIARSMSALSARVAPVKGRSVIGIELPNEERETVYLREIMEPLMRSPEPLPLALGKGINGEVQIASLAKMPHLLVAGTTGAGKSVAINAMILSLLYRHPPSECRMIMIDPKMLELSVYDGIPHLLSPVVTDPKKAVMALKWVVREMEGRYRKMADLNVRNLDGYNARMREAMDAGEILRRNVTDEFGEPRIEEYEPETLPYIVVVVDEMADLMMVAGKEIEACIQRLAQMARASGIHIIMATQRPSVDVITGTIKANFPTRISFQVTSKIDSRTILGEQGAEQLLGMGDMLYMAGGGRITRVHGPFVSDEEVQLVASELREAGEADDQVSFDEPSPDDGAINEILGLGAVGDGSAEDALYDQAVAIVAKDRRATTSYIQRRLQIGYNRAARIMEMMEEQGVISPANNAGKREILIEER